MARIEPLTWWRRLLALPNDNIVKTLVVAFCVALVSATVVSVTAITLKPRQLANLERERQARMQALVSSLPGLSDILAAGAGALEIRLVDLGAGDFARDVNPMTYDQRAAAISPEFSIALPGEIDTARIGRRAKLAPVYLVRRDQALALIVLPVHGTGYQSTIYAYLALKGDLEEVAAFTIYEQGETPGLGSRIMQPAWQAGWAGKRLDDEPGSAPLSVARGAATSPHEVDGITGATRSTSGITEMLRFWLGPHGFGPFLARLRSGEIAP